MALEKRKTIPKGFYRSVTEPSYHGSVSRKIFSMDGKLPMIYETKNKNKQEPFLIHTPQIPSTLRC